MPVPRSTSTPYRPRNVVNAPALEQALRIRSHARGDPPAIAAWLGNHFRRGIIGGFAHALPIASVADWHARQPGEPVPGWFGRGAMPCVYIDPEHPRLLALEQRVLEFLHAARTGPLAGKLHKITYAESLRRWHLAHARMRTRRLRGEFASHPQALRTLRTTAGGRVVELVGDSEQLRAELAYESFHMQHCLGDFADRRRLRGGYGEQYALSVLNRERRVLSLRDAGNRPHVTVSLVRAHGRWTVEQVKGKQNRPPVARYHAELVATFEHLGVGVDAAWDCACCGIVEVTGDTPQARPRVVHFSQAPSSPRARMLMAQCPWLLSGHPAADAPARWLALAGDARQMLQDDAPPSPWRAAARLAGAQGSPEEPHPSSGDAPAPVAGPAATWDGRYRSLNHPLRRRLHIAAFDRATALRQAVRWALATGDLVARREGGWRFLNDTPEAGLAPAHARQRLQALADARGGAIEDLPGAIFASPLLRQTAFFAHCQALGCDPLDVLVHDAVQATQLLRLAIAADVLARPRGLALLLLNAQRLQDCCRGWRDLGLAYSRGRHAVLRWRHRRHDIDYRVERELDAYLAERRCTWRALPWSLQPLLPPAWMHALSLPSVASPFLPEDPP